MTLKTSMHFLYCPCPTLDIAKALAHGIVNEKLAFCCNIIPGATSIFFWENRVQEGSEVILIVKVLNDDPQPTITYLESNHPYDVPFIAHWSADCTL